VYVYVLILENDCLELRLSIMAQINNHTSQEVQLQAILASLIGGHPSFALSSAKRFGSTLVIKRWFCTGLGARVSRVWTALAWEATENII
jgi:hypothetical protein